LSTNFRKFFTGAFCRQIATKMSLNIPPHENRVAIQPCKIICFKIAPTSFTAVQASTLLVYADFCYTGTTLL